MDVYLCEKPDQARNIAAVLGGVKKGPGYLDTAAGRVVWARGHLLQLVEPEDYNPAWEHWSLETLPMLPEAFKLGPRGKDSKALMAPVRDALKSAKRVIIATDPDREGEAIARNILEACRYRGPIDRLWLRGLDAVCIRQALGAIRAGAETAPLWWAATARARADWIWGLNLTRCASLLAQRAGHRGPRSIGRVQTPTLGLVVARDRAIESFVARDYFELAAIIEAEGQRFALRHAPSASPEDRRLYERAQADALAARAQGATGPLRVVTERVHRAPPALFSLLGLQKAANRLWGWSADRTLDVAQALYDAELTSYPRTDCPFLPAEQAAEIPQVLAALRATEELAAAVAGVGTPIVRKDVWDTAKCTAHHAIIPLQTSADLRSLSADERKAYLLIARQYLACLYPDEALDETRVSFDANGVLFAASGRVQVASGWRAVFQASDIDEDEQDAASGAALPKLADGAPAEAVRVSVEGKRTQPPKPYTEATLLEDMASVAKFATDPRIKARLKASAGLGTEATRAGIIKTIKKRGYIEAKGRTIRSTPLGRAVVDDLPGFVSDAAMTGIWEERLEAIAAGQLPESERDRFVGAVAEQLRKLIPALIAKGPPARSGDADESGFKDGPPTERMRKAAILAAKARGHKAPPREALESYAACRAFLDVSMPEVEARRASGRPSDAQVEYARRLGAERGLVVPEAVFTCRAACSEFISATKG